VAEQAKNLRRREMKAKWKMPSIKQLQKAVTDITGKTAEKLFPNAGQSPILIARYALQQYAAGVDISKKGYLKKAA
jgi:hypothetical protein